MIPSAIFVPSFLSFRICRCAVSFVPRVAVSGTTTKTYLIANADRMGDMATDRPKVNRHDQFIGG